MSTGRMPDLLRGRHLRQVQPGYGHTSVGEVRVPGSHLSLVPAAAVPDPA